MSLTQRIAVGVLAPAALLAATAAPAAAQPDLSYSYRYPLSIESVNSAPQLMAAVGRDLTGYFPFDSDCRSLPPVGARCELYAISGLPLPGTTNPVEVVERTPTSWTFVSLPGHGDGADRYFTFSFENRHGFALTVTSWGPWTLPASITAETGVARATWQQFADRVSARL